MLNTSALAANLLLPELYDDHHADLGKQHKVEQPPANWPGQHVGPLTPVERTHDSTAEIHSVQALSDCYHYSTGNGRLAAAASRHTRKKSQKWVCHLFICDHAGNEWSRDFPAVTDDFGWLVEVPAC